VYAALIGFGNNLKRGRVTERLFGAFGAVGTGGDVVLVNGAVTLVLPAVSDPAVQRLPL